MIAWADRPLAERHWADARALDDSTLLELLEVATEQCAAFAGYVPPAPVVTVAPLPAIAPLVSALEDGTRSCAIQVLGDSTGNDTFEWPYTLAQTLAAKYPAWTVVHRLWDDTAQDYATPTVLQTGTAGARWLELTNGAFPRKLPNGHAPHLSGVIDVRVDLTAADWTPANAFGSTILLSEGGGTGNWGWYFSVNTAGVLQFVGSTNGTALDVIMNATAATGLADGSRAQVRAVFTPNDGAGNRTCSFYKSTDNGATWTQIGTTVTTAGAVTLSDRIGAGSWYQLGGSGAAANVTAFQIHGVQIRNGANGPSIVPRLPDLWGSYGAGTTQPVVGAPVLTIVNGSKPGANIAYLDDATRRPKMTPDYGQLLTLLSDSHNEVGATGSLWTSLYSTWVGNVRSRVGGGIVALTQNPEQPAAFYAAEHARRREDLLGLAPLLGVGLIDTWQAFIDAGWPGALMADDVHPNTAGQLVWRDAVYAQFGVTTTVDPAVDVPTRYRLAVVYQAREVYAAAKREGDVIGVGDYAIRSRPLTGAVKQLLRPATYSLFVGTES